eukprot:5300312-Ditylum_brightwellii.AAC.1
MSTGNTGKSSKPGDAEGLDVRIEIEADDESDNETNQDTSVKFVGKAKEEAVSDSEWEEFQQTRLGQVIRPV